MSKTTRQTRTDEKGRVWRIISCCECGAEFEGFRVDAAFCNPSCVVAFGNRRRERGAVLYDLMMINRHERGVAKRLKVWFLVTRLLMYWREMDFRDNEGRRSWQDAARAVQKQAWALATVVHRGK